MRHLSGRMQPRVCLDRSSAAGAQDFSFWCLRPPTRTSFHHQPEAQHPKSSDIHKNAQPITPSLGQRATYRHVVTMSDMPPTTDIGVHAYWVIQVARWHGVTVKRGQGVIVSPISGSVTGCLQRELSPQEPIAREGRRRKQIEQRVTAVATACSAHRSPAVAATPAGRDPTRANP
jgi:hypothetical protein